MQDVIPITIRRVAGQSIGMTPFRYSIADCRAGRGGPNSAEMLDRCYFATQHGGLPVQSVRAGSPADEAGLLPWDVIVSIQGMPIGTYAGEQCIEYIRNIPEWQDILLQIVRETPHGNRPMGGGNGQFVPPPLYQEYEDRDESFYDDNSRDYTQFGTGHQVAGRDNRFNNKRALPVGTGYIANPGAHDDYDSYADHYENYNISHMPIHPAQPPQQQQQQYQQQQQQPPYYQNGNNNNNNNYQPPPPQHYQQQQQYQQPPPAMPIPRSPVRQQPMAPPPVAALPPTQPPQPSRSSNSPFLEIRITRDPGLPLGLTPFKYSLLDCESQKDGFNFTPMLAKCGFAKKYGGGLPVQFVVPSTPASKAGILPWDVILTINGTDIRTWTGDKIINLLKGIHSDLVLKVVRSGVIQRYDAPQQQQQQPQSIPQVPSTSSPIAPNYAPMTVEAPKPANGMQSSSQSEPVKVGNNLLDITIRKTGASWGMTPFKYSISDAETGKDHMNFGEILKKLEFAREHGGLPIQFTQSWGLAAKAGVKPWDVIVAVNRASMKQLSGEQCVNALKAGMDGGDVVLTICRSPVPIAAPVLQPVGSCCSCVGLFGSSKPMTDAQLPPLDDDTFNKHIVPTNTNVIPAVTQPTGSNEVWESCAL